jgi:hypothetical protein
VQCCGRKDCMLLMSLSVVDKELSFMCFKLIYARVKMYDYTFE